MSTNRARAARRTEGVCDAGALQRCRAAPSPGGPVVLGPSAAQNTRLRRHTLRRWPCPKTAARRAAAGLELESESLLAWRQLAAGADARDHELAPSRSLSQSALAVGRRALRRRASARGAGRHRAKKNSLATFVGTYRRVSQWPAPDDGAGRTCEPFVRLERAVAPAWLGGRCGGPVRAGFAHAAPAGRSRTARTGVARLDQQRGWRPRPSSGRASPVGARAPDARRPAADRRARQRPRRAARPGTPDLPAVFAKAARARRGRGAPARERTGGCAMCVPSRAGRRSC